MRFTDLDEALGDPEGFGRVEYAYHKIAATVGIERLFIKFYRKIN